ncbi:MAG: RidA family protein [Pseudomonadota bacterium]
MPCKTTNRVASAFVAAALAAGVTSSASAADREVIVPDAWKRSYEDLHYAPAVRAGDLLILSGVVAGLGPDPDDTDAAAGYDRAFKAIGQILKEAGADWDDVVEIQTFHTDLPAQIAEFGAVKDRYIKEPYPAWTAIDIDRLYPDRGLVEIKITAYTGD